MSASLVLSSDDPTRSDSRASSSSAVSLTRRSRTRIRSRTLTSDRPEKSPKTPPTDMLPPPPPPDHLVARLHPEDLKTISSGGPVADIGPPERPPRSPKRISVNVEDLKEKLEVIAAAESSSFGSAPVEFHPDELTKVGQAKSVSDFHSSKAGRRGASLPRLENIRVVRRHDSFEATSPQSVFHQSPNNVRESVFTHKTGTSSSVYPPSTSNSTVSGTDSPPSPRSLAQQEEHNGISSYDPDDVGELEDLHTDDVSYRLRLLVKNNYFLPPAHSKPSPSDFSSATLVPPKKSTTPTFLDLFRMGKSKSKPPTPEPASQTADHFTPILRTTSDSTTASGYAPRPKPRSQPQPPLAVHPGGPQDRAGRVVVVREKMEDLVSAAKQAEQDLKAREVRKEESHREVLDDVIDPTDAVDLPPPPAGYPLAVQASAIHGFGIQDSIGAALLADYLPPGTPGYLSSLESEENAWRKALLREAVGLSLNNSPAPSSNTSHVPSSSMSSSREPASPVTSYMNTGSVRMKRVLEQHILVPPVIEQDEEPSPQTTHSSTRPSTDIRRVGLSSPDPHPVSRTSYLPARADTPGVPRTPLAPPPRRQIVNPLYSLSQTDLPNIGERSLSPAAIKVVRKSVSSPLLSEAYEFDIRHAMTLTPPPMPTLSVSPPPVPPLHKQRSSSSLPHRAKDSISLYSQYSGYENDDILVPQTEGPPRPSMSPSLPTDGRPSLSIYSQPSPSSSVFHDAYSDGYHSAISAVQRFSAENRSSRASSIARAAPRYSTMSPPPRVSSSLANVALSPPPRSSSLNKSSMPKASTSHIPSPRASEHERPPQTPEQTPPAESMMAPSPATPPYPGSEGRRNNNPLSLTLDIPTGHIPVDIHSAPGPSSPTTFFDCIQSHPNAMDDLDSSDSEEEGGNELDDHQTTTTVFVDPRTQVVSNRPSTSPPRPSFMRLGNHSSPYLVHSVEGPRPSSREDRKKPVTNAPLRSRLFSFKKSGKSDQEHNSASMLDVYPYPQQGRHSSGGEPSVLNTSPFASLSDLKSSLRRPATSAGEEARARRPQRESLMRFDGMLVQHMETERDTMKKIASSNKRRGF